VLSLDVTDPVSVQAAVQRVRETAPGGHLYALVNNAGQAEACPCRGGLNQPSTNPVWPWRTGVCRYMGTSVTGCPE
jgi:NAD(P)-dependent dehydrogenase (short-subunit alcohol dehydrogenase family)